MDLSPSPACRMRVNPGTAMITKHITWVFLGTVPILAFFTWLLFRRHRYNYAEHLILHAFLSGFRVFFFILIFTPLVIFFRQYYFSVLGVYLALWVAFIAWANTQFFGGKKWPVIGRTILAVVLTQVAMTAVLMVVVYAGRVVEKS